VAKTLNPGDAPAVRSFLETGPRFYRAGPAQSADRAHVPAAVGVDHRKKIMLSVLGGEATTDFTDK
jgi:hypothetical protein